MEHSLIVMTEQKSVIVKVIQSTAGSYSWSSSLVYLLSTHAQAKQDWKIVIILFQIFSLNNKDHSLRICFVSLIARLSVRE